MGRKGQRMTLTSGASKGFSLLELLIAVVVVGVAFTFLFELTAQARSRLEVAQNLFSDLVYLDAKIKRKDHEGLSVSRRRVPDFPRVEEVDYSYGSAVFVQFRMVK